MKGSISGNRGEFGRSNKDARTQEKVEGYPYQTEDIAEAEQTANCFPFFLSLDNMSVPRKDKEKYESLQLLCSCCC